MMMCSKCHDTEGPFIVDTKIGKVLCDDCYTFNEIADKCVELIRSKARVKNNLSMTAVTLMDSLEIAVFDKLEIN